MFVHIRDRQTRQRLRVCKECIEEVSFADVSIGSDDLVVPVENSLLLQRTLTDTDRKTAFGPTLHIVAGAGQSLYLTVLSVITYTSQQSDSMVGDSTTNSESKGPYK